MIGTHLWRMRFDPAWQLTRWPIVVIGASIAGSWCVHAWWVLLASLSGGSSGPSVEEVRLNAPMAEVRERVERVLQAENDHQAVSEGNPDESKRFSLGAKGEWWMVTIPEGKRLGSVAFINAWKSSPFDRWQWRKGGGLVASAPQVSVLFISSEQPAETKVRIEMNSVNAKPRPEETEALRIRLINAASGS